MQVATADIPENIVTDHRTVTAPIVAGIDGAGVGGIEHNIVNVIVFDEVFVSFVVDGHVRRMGNFIVGTDISYATEENSGLVGLIDL